MTKDLEMAPRYGDGGAYLPPPARHGGGGGAELDDDGMKKRTGTVWTASAHIITAVIGSGVLSLAWSTAQLGWLFGPVTMMIFSLITYYTSCLLADCYRSGDQVVGKRNYTYMDAVAAYLDSWQVWTCGVFQYVNLVGTAVGYTITASICAAAVYKANCYHRKGHDADCGVYTTIYMVVFGAVQILFSQLPNFHNLTWLSIISAIMSFTYSFIGVGLSLARTITVLAIIMPFFNDILGFLGAIGFWPLTVYYPVEMYIRQRKIKKLTTRWIALQCLSLLCFLVSLAAAVGSIQGVTVSLKSYVPFKTKT
ncbi:hypothetical protein PR202_gb27685 [Eleusine coracana subsp. coracana]|uniref:Amino acid transporter transmembrane domain-containing protein n=1 Tax=Eleusine coracana subsp. coracana TaxID=191504 RepID=A0AAV5FVN4_ELECO|nr:hypothetical protein PR202_gb27685 [Eleusine coracana subsp. coracana]